jgi:sortase A
VVISVIDPSADEPEVSEPGEDSTAPAALSGPPKSGLLVMALAVIMFVSVVIVFFGAFAFVLGGLQEQRSQHQLYSQFRGLLDPSSPVAPHIGGAIPDGSPVALLNSPAAGLHNVVIVEGTSAADLLSGPGHRSDTPLPGQAGESVLLGRSTTAGAPFGHITRLQKGDVITVTTGQGRFRYAVQGQLRAGDRLPTITTRSGLLTLVTSAGSGTFGRLAPNHLVYVEAKLQGNAVATPPGQPRSVPAAEIQGHNDPGAWMYVGLWMAAMIATAIVCWRLWSRSGLLKIWLVGAPVLLGLLWGFSTEGMRLLPNVF